MCFGKKCRQCLQERYLACLIGFSSVLIVLFIVMVYLLTTIDPVMVVIETDNSSTREQSDSTNDSRFASLSAQPIAPFLTRLGSIKQFNRSTSNIIRKTEIDQQQTGRPVSATAEIKSPIRRSIIADTKVEDLILNIVDEFGRPRFEIKFLPIQKNSKDIDVKPLVYKVNIKASNNSEYQTFIEKDSVKLMGNVLSVFNRNHVNVSEHNIYTGKHSNEEVTRNSVIKNPDEINISLATEKAEAVSQSIRSRPSNYKATASLNHTRISSTNDSLTTTNYETITQRETENVTDIYTKENQIPVTSMILNITEISQTKSKILFSIINVNETVTSTWTPLNENNFKVDSETVTVSGNKIQVSTMNVTDKINSNNESTQGESEIDSAGIEASTNNITNIYSLSGLPIEPDNKESFEKIMNMNK